MSDKAAIKKRTPMDPRPSSSVILVSPLNQILLLHRVQTSSAFPSAHVFPGGNVSTFHDGEVPDANHPKRHVDNKAYRIAAIRETFEESGILLAKSTGSGGLLGIADPEREEGRKAIHAGSVSFLKWLEEKGGVPDIENLIPFTRWITPPQVPKRFTTQMYLYFLPLPTFESADPTLQDIGPLPRGAEAIIPKPTHDGGVEHTAARFFPSQKWLELADSGDITLFPPQYFLLSMVGRFLTPTRQDAYSNIDFLRQRRALEAFVRGGTLTPWADVCISPVMLAATDDGRSILTLSTPGDEVKKLGRHGVDDYVVVLGRGKGGMPKNVEVKLRKDVQHILDKAKM